MALQWLPMTLRIKSRPSGVSPRPAGRRCPVSGRRLSPQIMPGRPLMVGSHAAVRKPPLVTRAAVRPPVAPHLFTPVWFLHTACHHGRSPRFPARVFPEAGGSRARALPAAEAAVDFSAVPCTTTCPQPAGGGTWRAAPGRGLGLSVLPVPSLP